jgi:hypothetical protein
MLSGTSISHGDPIARIILGVTGASRPASKLVVGVGMLIFVTTLIARSWFEPALARQARRESRS